MLAQLDVEQAASNPAGEHARLPAVLIVKIVALTAAARDAKATAINNASTDVKEVALDFVQAVVPDLAMKHAFRHAGVVA